MLAPETPELAAAAVEAPESSSPVIGRAQANSDESVAQPAMAPPQARPKTGSTSDRSSAPPSRAPTRAPPSIDAPPSAQAQAQTHARRPSRTDPRAQPAQPASAMIAQADMYSPEYAMSPYAHQAQDYMLPTVYPGQQPQQFMTYGPPQGAGQYVPTAGVGATQGVYRMQPHQQQTQQRRAAPLYASPSYVPQQAQAYPGPATSGHGPSGPMQAQPTSRASRPSHAHPQAPAMARQQQQYAPSPQADPSYWPHWQQQQQRGALPPPGYYVPRQQQPVGPYSSAPGAQPGARQMMGPPRAAPAPGPGPGPMPAQARRQTGPPPQAYHSQMQLAPTQTHEQGVWEEGKGMQGSFQALKRRLSVAPGVAQGGEQEGGQGFEG